MPTCTACEILRVASAALLQNQVSAARLTLLAQTWRECSPAQGGGAACDGTLYTEWSTAFTRWMDLARGMAMRNLIAKAGIVRLDTSGGTVIVHQYLLSPIAPSISSNYTCVVSATYTQVPTHLHFHMANMEGRNNKSYYGAAFGGPCMASSYRRPFCSDSREPRFARIPSILKVVSEQEKDLCTSAAATRSCVG